MNKSLLVTAFDTKYENVIEHKVNWFGSSIRLLRIAAIRFFDEFIFILTKGAQLFKVRITLMFSEVEKFEKYIEDYLANNLKNQNDKAKSMSSYFGDFLKIVGGQTQEENSDF